MQKKISSIVRVPALFIIFVVLGLAFGFVTFRVLSYSRAVHVPSLHDMSLLEADEALNKVGLYLKIEGEDYDAKVQPGRIVRQDIPAMAEFFHYHSSWLDFLCVHFIAPGRIVRQDIPAGYKVKEKRSIGVVVSKGPRVYSIPLIVNMPLGDAEEVLMEKGLKIGQIIRVHSDSVGKNRIVAQEPGPDERLTGPITVLVSAGAQDIEYYCPDFAGKDIEDARQVAQKMGLTVETTGSGAFVASQKPSPGTEVKSGDALQLALTAQTAND